MPLEYQVDLFLTLKCNICGNEESYSDSSTKKELREKAQKDGWTWSGQNVRCPDCNKLLYEMMCQVKDESDDME